MSMVADLLASPEMRAMIESLDRVIELTRYVQRCHGLEASCPRCRDVDALRAAIATVEAARERMR
jgi:hypothetical protein